MQKYESKILLDKYIEQTQLNLYLTEAAKANQYFNLYSRSLDESALRILIAESLLPHHISWMYGFSGRLLDIGSGWGIPAIPLLMARPDTDVTMIERSSKKADWLALINSKLGLKARVESADLLEFRPKEPFDMIMSRQVGLDNKIMKKIKSVSRETTIIIVYGMVPEVENLNITDVFEYIIDNSPAKKLYKARF